MWPLLCWGAYLLCPLSAEISSWMGATFLSKTFSTSIEMITWLYSSVCWCSVPHWLIWGYWKLHTSLGWIPLYHGLWSFQGIVGFRLLVFCWRFLYLCSSMIWDCNFLFFVLHSPGFIISFTKFSFFWNSWNSFTRIGINCPLNIW